MPSDQIQYSEKYYDEVFEYRHVILPPDLAKYMRPNHMYYCFDVHERINRHNCRTIQHSLDIIYDVTRNAGMLYSISC
ncbi:AGAP003796-PA-like protein [Anopheles sinensis]|uniref:Cyclin-dependent kinases regulatory subunit n=1 Tax=Anopheles sinensis TaxID=74873 RepID=A0A084VU69_ANOSI|nr:AGAP003796-PA-like protein [Anopheles sinensis]